MNIIKYLLKAALFLLKTSLFGSAHYLAIGALAIVAYIIGRRLTRRFDYHSLLEQWVFSTALGLGVVAYAIFFLGLLGGLYTTVTLAVLAASVLLCYPVWACWPREAFGLWARIKAWTAGRRASVIVFTLLGVALLLPMAILPLYPPTHFDATMYHLPYAKIFTQRHGVVPTPDLRYIVAPQASEMLFTLALLVYDDILAQLTQFLMMILTAAATIAFGQRYFTPRVGWWAAAMWLASPLVLWLGASAYVDIGVGFYATMTIYGFWNWVETQRTRWLILSGIFCGLAIGTKLLALFFLAVLGAVTLRFVLKKRRYIWPLAFGLPALLVALPWLARSFYYTGNPIYPLFHSTVGKALGGEAWKPQYSQDVFEMYWTLRYVGRLLLEILRLPWNLAFAQDEVFSGQAWISPIYPLALPVTLIAFIFGARFRWLLALVAAYTPFWYFTIADLRYLIPILPPLGLVIAAAADHLLRRLPWGERWLSRPALTALGCVLLISMAWVDTVDRIYTAGRLPITPRQRDNYLTERLPTYRLYRRLNELKGSDYQLYAAFDTQMAYFADGRFLGDWFGRAPYYILNDGQLSKGGVHSREWRKKGVILVDGEALYKTLRRTGADHLLMPTYDLRITLPEDDFFRSRFKIIAASAQGLLFELTEQPWRLTSGPNLLHNPGFEELENGCPKAWTCVGKPVIAVARQSGSEGSGAGSVDGAGAQLDAQPGYSGLVAVKSVGDGNVLFQTVPVRPGALYVLSFKARAASPGQETRLQVNWNDEKGAFMATDIKVTAPGAEWQTFTMKVSAPPGASAALVFASGHGAGSIWFDEFVFAELKYELLH